MSALSGSTWNTGLASPLAGSCHRGTLKNAVTLTLVLLVTTTAWYSAALRREQEPNSRMSVSTVTALPGSWPPNSSRHASGPGSACSAPALVAPPGLSPSLPASLDPADSGFLLWCEGTGEGGTLPTFCTSASTGGAPLSTRLM